MNRILSVSCDPSLLASRESILTSRGLSVTSVLCVRDALPYCDSGEFRLLIVGHTIANDRKPELIARFRSRCGGVVLALHTALEQPVSYADYTYDTSHGPERFLSFVCKAIGLETKNVSQAGASL